MDQQIPEIRISRGLQGIYADRTETTYIDGKEGTLEYRGYSIHDLAENSTFEEVAYLLLYGSLPNKTQLNEAGSGAQSRPRTSHADSGHHRPDQGRPPDGRTTYRRVGTQCLRPR